MKKLILALVLCTAPALAQMPDPVKTPGDAVAVPLPQLCTKGYAGQVRNVPESEKLAVYRAYGMAKPRTGYCTGPSGCEIDHLISLELGGANTPKNLWPQPYDGPWNAHLKDKVENKLHELVCHGKLPLAEAQKQISHDWRVPYRQYIDPHAALK